MLKTPQQNDLLALYGSARDVLEEALKKDDRKNLVAIYALLNPGSNKEVTPGAPPSPFPSLPGKCVRMAPGVTSLFEPSVSQSMGLFHIYHRKGEGFA